MAASRWSATRPVTRPGLICGLHFIRALGMLEASNQSQSLRRRGSLLKQAQMVILDKLSINADVSNV